ncbi:MAG: hypothetical protein R2706_18315 [Acidimicrobiales bacterium]
MVEIRLVDFDTVDEDVAVATFDGVAADGNNPLDQVVHRAVEV